jgi:tRNA pseudouridine55 synthase
MEIEPHGLLIVDKAAGPTSHDVVGIARRALGTRAIGHTGTLDPMATGVLVLAVGEATKLVNLLGASTKAYEATIALGRSTTTLDAQGEEDGSAPVPRITHADVVAAAAGFLGDIEQRAPKVSAIKVEGKSLYARARKGEQFEAPVRRVRLESVEIRAVQDAAIEVALRCGSGFYVRSFARDLALALGTLGHLTALRRTENGAFSLAQAVTFETLRAAARDADLRPALRERLLPLQTICLALPHVRIDEEGVRHARHGRPIPLTSVVGEPLDGTHLALDARDEPIAIVEVASEQLRVMRGFRSKSEPT